MIQIIPILPIENRDDALCAALAIAFQGLLKEQSVTESEAKRIDQRLRRKRERFASCYQMIFDFVKERELVMDYDPLVHSFFYEFNCDIHKFVKKHRELIKDFVDELPF